jgi:hypothetical protein
MRQKQSIKHFSFFASTSFLCCFARLCCFEEKSNRFSLTRQGLTLFHTSHQVFVRIHGSRVIPIGRDSYFTQSTRAETLCQNPYDFGRASALEQTRVEKPYQTPKEPRGLTTLPTRLHLPTTLRMRTLQVEFLKCGVCVMISTRLGYL